MGYWESSGKSDDWFTPKHVFDALGCRFNTDVAAPIGGPLHVPAGCWLTQEEDGLAYAPFWYGFIWMNPPFGGRNSVSLWLNKFFEHGNGIALTPDRTSAPWFRDAWPKADMVMFTPKIRFLRPDGSEGKSPSNGTALWAVGEQGVEALNNAAVAGLGIIAKPRIAVVPMEKAA